jgi:hypothetical protein
MPKIKTILVDSKGADPEASTCKMKYMFMSHDQNSIKEIKSPLNLGMLATT